MKMKLFVTSAIALAMTAAAVFADEARFAGRGWTDEGVHQVAYTDNGDMKYVTAEELALAGVDIYNQGEVFAYLELVDQNFGSCGATNKDPDGCFEDDGVAGSTTGPELDRDIY